MLGGTLPQDWSVPGYCCVAVGSFLWARYSINRVFILDFQIGQEIVTSVTLTVGHELCTLPSILCSLVPKIGPVPGEWGFWNLMCAEGSWLVGSLFCQKFLACPTSAQESSLEFVLTVYSLSVVVWGVPELGHMCAHLRHLPSSVIVKSLYTGHE